MKLRFVLGCLALGLGLITMATHSDKKIPPKDHFPCAICDNPVTWSTNGVCCDDCSVWHHISCTEIPKDNYENLENVFKRIETINNLISFLIF